MKNTTRISDNSSSTKLRGIQGSFTQSSSFPDVWVRDSSTSFPAVYSHSFFALLKPQTIPPTTTTTNPLWPWQLQCDHPAWCRAYSNAIKLSPGESVKRRLELQANTKETHLKRSQAQPEEVRGLFTEQQSLIGCTLPWGVSTANR